MTDEDVVDGDHAAKRAAGRAALGEIRDGMTIGLGTGSTVAPFLDALAESGRAIRGVATSEATAARARELGLDLVDPAEVTHLDLTVDGADELTPALVLTKGGGGALLREKVVAAMSDHLVVVATPDKVVDRLGRTFALPVEVVPFAAAPVTRALVARGYQVTTRDGRTDNGNVILDARHPDGIADPQAEATALSCIPGIAEHGLFVDLATVALLGLSSGDVQRRTPVA